jgi:Tfp pilus assembly protein PilF
MGCLNNYAYFLSESGEQLAKAEQMSYRTVKAEPKNATYLDTYAWILYMLGRYSEANIYIDQALQNLDESMDNSVIKEHAEKIKQKIDQ